MTVLTRSKEAALLQNTSHYSKSHYGHHADHASSKRALRSGRVASSRRSQSPTATISGVLTRSKQPFLNISLFENSTGNVKPKAKPTLTRGVKATVNPRPLDTAAVTKDSGGLQVRPATPESLELKQTPSSTLTEISTPRAKSLPSRPASPKAVQEVNTRVDTAKPESYQIVSYSKSAVVSEAMTAEPTIRVCTPKTKCHSSLPASPSVQMTDSLLSANHCPLVLPKTSKKIDATSSSPTSSTPMLGAQPASLEATRLELEGSPLKDGSSKVVHGTHRTAVLHIPTSSHTFQLSQNFGSFAKSDSSASSLPTPPYCTDIAQSLKLEALSAPLNPCAVASRLSKFAVQVECPPAPVPTPAPLSDEHECWLTPEQLISQHGLGASLPPAKIEVKVPISPCPSPSSPPLSPAENLELRIDDLVDLEAAFALPSPRVSKASLNASILPAKSVDEVKEFTSLRPSFQWTCTPEIEMEDFEGPVDDPILLGVTADYEDDLLV